VTKIRAVPGGLASFLQKYFGKTDPRLNAGLQIFTDGGFQVAEDESHKRFRSWRSDNGTHYFEIGHALVIFLRLGLVIIRLTGWVVGTGRSATKK